MTLFNPGREARVFLWEFRHLAGRPVIKYVTKQSDCRGGWRVVWWGTLKGWGHRMLTPAELVWLIAAVAKGDEAAFERLYAATRAKLFGVVLRILRRQDLAEEVIQEAYVKIWNSAGQFNPGVASPITWMASIARNRAIDVVRKRTEASIEEEPAAMEVAADTPDPLARREMTEELKRLLECVGRLEPDRQKLVLLAYYNGWSREQLAAKFETPVNTVKTWLRRSMMDIRACLGLE
jgi:RNA polymerase sigma-70 factor (ECF subfamily)